MTAGPASGHVGRRATDYGRPRGIDRDYPSLDQILGQAFDEIEQMGGGEQVPGASLGAQAVSRRMSRFRDLGQLVDLLGELIGVGATERIRRLIGELTDEAFALEGSLVEECRRAGRLRDERDSARGIAVALEAENADLQRVTYAGRLEHQIRMITALLGPDTDPQPFLDAARKEAREMAASLERTTTVVDVPLLPVVDDASLPPRRIAFRGPGGELLAVGALERVFGPLDTATEIALGADGADVPDAAHPLTEDVRGAAVWPDGVIWQSPTELRPTWLLEDAPEAFACVVAAPACRPDEAPRPVDVGGEWACPLCAEGPRPYDEPVGPVDPPRPPHHHPFA